MRVAVLGGGIAGLASAIALKKAGLEPEVFEQAPEITEVGAGLQVGPNGARVLAHLGLGDALIEGGTRAQAVVLRNGPSGVQVARVDVAAGNGGHGYYFLHRADLVTMLSNGAWASQIPVHLGQKVVAVRPGTTVEVEFADGRSAEFDLVVGADGVHSVARKAVGGVEPSFTGQVAWRALVRTHDPTEPIAQVHMGPGRHLVHYPLAGGRLINIVAVEERDDWTADGWAQPDDSARMRAAFADFSLPVRDLLGKVEGVHLWGLHLYPILPNWSKGGLVLAGDAAHPMLPFLGQGANMALEDAAVLGRCLEGATDPAEALARFQSIRRDRVARVVRASQANAVNYHRRGLAKTASHAVLGVLGRIAPGALTRRFDWLYGYDATLA